MSVVRERCISYKVREEEQAAEPDEANGPGGGALHVSNPNATEGARGVLIQSGLSEAWWPLALLICIAMCNGFVIGKNGMTPHRRIHGGEDPN